MSEQDLRRRVEPPRDRVLDLLGRVRLVEELREEELEKAAVVAQPVVAVVLRPAVVLLERRVEVVLGAPRVRRRQERERRRDRDDPEHAVGVIGGERQRVAPAARQSRDHRLLDPGGVEHGDRIGHVLRVGICRLLPGPVREPVPATVERHDAEMARQIVDLRLPVARVDDRPRRHQQDRRLAGAVGLPPDSHAVALDVAGVVGQACGRLGRGPAHRGDPSHTGCPSTKRRPTAWPRTRG